MKVLYIEDNAANMMLVKQLLARSPQYQLLEAVTAEQGLEIVRAEMPAVVLMDINLPGMSGFEALEVMQKEGLTQKIKVIAISANALLSEVQRGNEAGFDYYLTKPINFPQLLSTLQEISDSQAE
jgi:CheY-like chemotaxis protein